MRQESQEKVRVVRKRLVAAVAQLTGAFGTTRRHVVNMTSSRIFRELRPALTIALLALAACFLLTSFPHTASAARQPDVSERNSIATLIPGLTPECADILISTVDETWGSLDSLNTPGCLQGNGFIVVNRDTEGWYVFMQSSGDTCPLKDLHTSITADLQLCPPVSSLPYFYSHLKGELVIKPKLLGQGAHGGFVKIRWQSWGNARATGRGVFDYSDHYLRFRIPVKFRLYGARTCDNGVRIFTRRKLTAVHKKHAKRIRWETRNTRFGKCSENQYAPIG